MTRKISLSIFIVSLVSIFVAMSLTVIVFGWIYSENTNHSLKCEAELAAKAVSLSGEGFFESIGPANRITWIDSDGHVIADTQNDAATLESHADREEFIQAVEHGEGISRRYSDTMSEQTVYYAMRLDDGTVIRVSATQHTVASTYLSLSPYFICIFLVILVISGAFARKLSKKIVEPINEIDLSEPEFSDSYIELSPLLHKLKRQNELIRNQMNDLRTTAQKFQTITKNMSEGIIIIDSQSRILSYNPASVDLLGAGTASVGESVLTLNGTEAFAECIENALAKKHSKTILSDPERAYQVFANPVSMGDDGEGAVIVILDITDKERAEALRREFTSNVSHELKTPLTSIYGISEIMANGIVKAEDVPKFARDINMESGRLITLVNDIIRLSQLDENTFNDQKAPLDLMDAANEAAQTLSAAAQKRGVQISISGEKTQVSAIYSVIYEMIYNLIDNAIKYNTEGGSVIIRITPNPHPSITVSDTGIGIPREHLSRVFERFYRVDKSHSRSIGGTGLGLSIVKHAAAYHNADISIFSEVGKGTSVTVEFKEQ